MRLTVGPLPPAVYWRRRAIVVGGLLALVFGPYAACMGGDEPSRRTAGDQAAREPAGGPAAPQPTVSATGAAGGTGEEPAADEPGQAPVVAGGAAPAGPPQAPPLLNAPTCTDSDLDLRALPATAEVPVGGALDIRLVVENASTRTCARDVGADAQELRITREGQTVWSSDHCTPRGGPPNVQGFPPGERREFMVTWNGRSSTGGAACVKGAPAGELAAGAYEVVARLGGKHSAPAPLTLR
ncbi:MAG TPA: hypothetical protein VFY17_10500 [Pilimelia sp.]|nr:hypothetical protein [Pilimelia sp.]